MKDVNDRLNRGVRDYAADITRIHSGKGPYWTCFPKYHTMLAFCVRAHVKGITFDLRLMSWGDGSGVPTSGNNLIIVGTDNLGLLHIRIFNAGGDRFTDTDDTKLPTTQAKAISTLKQQLPGLLYPHLLTSDEKAQVISEVTSIVRQIQGIPEVDRVDDLLVGIVLRQRYEDRRLGNVLQAGQSSATLANKHGLSVQHGQPDDLIDYGAKILFVSQLRAASGTWFDSLVAAHLPTWNLVQAVFVDGMTLVDSAGHCGGNLAEKSIEDLRKCLGVQMQEVLELVQTQTRHNLPTGVQNKP
jgi:hypothetical protein